MLIVLLVLSLLTISCATEMTPQQKRTWATWDTCQARERAQSVQLKYVTPEGGVQLFYQPDDPEWMRMKQCLTEQGWRFQEGGPS